jgi:hypothetical protein
VRVFHSPGRVSSHLLRPVVSSPLRRLCVWLLLRLPCVFRRPYASLRPITITNHINASTWRTRAPLPHRQGVASRLRRPCVSSRPEKSLSIATQLNRKKIQKYKNQSPRRPFSSLRPHLPCVSSPPHQQVVSFRPENKQVSTQCSQCNDNQLFTSSANRFFSASSALRFASAF